MIFHGVRTKALPAGWAIAELVLHPSVQAKLRHKVDAIARTPISPALPALSPLISLRRDRATDISRLSPIPSSLSATSRVPATAPNSDSKSSASASGFVPAPWPLLLAPFGLQHPRPLPPTPSQHPRPLPSAPSRLQVLSLCLPSPTPQSSTNTSSVPTPSPRLTPAPSRLQVLGLCLPILTPQSSANTDSIPTPSPRPKSAPSRLPILDQH